jgi:hypothetical protein
MAAPEKKFTPRTSKRYEDVDEIKDVDGVVAVITRATSNGSLAVGFFKEFDPGDGELQRTAFCREKQLEAIERLIPLVRARMAELRASAEIPGVGY